MTYYEYIKEIATPEQIAQIFDYQETDAGYYSENNTQAIKQVIERPDLDNEENSYTNYAGKKALEILNSDIGGKDIQIIIDSEKIPKFIEKIQKENQDKERNAILFILKNFIENFGYDIIIETQAFDTSNKKVIIKDNGKLTDSVPEKIIYDLNTGKELSRKDFELD
jgi:hypothetical protein